jgi:hypothetical protein
MRPHGRARVSVRNPQAFGICDRCGFLYNHVNLSWQFDWAGANLINKRILVCETCIDTPQEQLRAIVLPADPNPIMNARVDIFTEAESDYITTSAPTVTDSTTGIPVPSNTTVVSENGDNYTSQPIGAPNGLDPNAIMNLQGTVAYGKIVPYLSVSSTGTTTITVTCYSAHGLSNNSQVAVEGLTNSLATGFYSVTVTNPLVFTYITYSPIPSGSLITSTTLIRTANVGLPYDYSQIPQVGP